MNSNPTAIDFNQLVREHQTVVMGLGQAMGLRGADLDDAAAEAFAAVFLALPGFRGDASIATWIYRIAWRAISKARARRPIASATITATEPATDLGPIETVEMRETNRQLWQAVQSLEPMQSAVTELYYRRQWTVGEIADVLECPPGTVKTLLHRARAKLRSALTEMEVYR